MPNQGANLFSDLLVEAGPFKREARVLGVGLHFFAVHQMRTSEGTIFGPETEYSSRVAVLGQEVASEIFPAMSAIGQTIRVNRVEYEVIGVLKSSDNMQLYGERQAIIVPLDSGVKRIFGRDNVGVIELEAEDAEPSALENELRRELSALLRVPKSFGTSAFRVKSVQSMKDEIEQIGLMVTIFLMFVSCVALFVGGIGIFNIMLVSVTERTREIGIRKAIGASRGDIFRQFLMESITICLWGGLLGTLGAVGLCMMSNVLLPDFPIPLSPWIIALAGIFSTLVGLLAGVAPARKAAALNPIEAIRFC